MDQWRQLSESGRYQVVVKFHPKMDSDLVKAYRVIANDNLQVSDDDSLVPLIQQADLVVSDTSSAVTEALLMGKVVVTFNNAQPEASLLNFTQPEQLAEQLALGLNPSAELLQQIAHYIEQVHPYQDGQSAQRILSAVDKVLAEGLKRKPLNLHRRIKSESRWLTINCFKYFSAVH